MVCPCKKKKRKNNKRRKKGSQRSNRIARKEGNVLFFLFISLLFFAGAVHERVVALLGFENGFKYKKRTSFSYLLFFFFY